MKYFTDLILGKGFCIFIFFYFPDSSPSVLNGLRCYFSLRDSASREFQTKIVETDTIFHTKAATNYTLWRRKYPYSLYKGVPPGGVKRVADYESRCLRKRDQQVDYCQKQVDHKAMNLETRNKQNGSKSTNHELQTMTF